MAGPPFYSCFEGEGMQPDRERPKRAVSSVRYEHISPLDSLRPIWVRLEGRNGLCAFELCLAVYSWKPTIKPLKDCFHRFTW
eukprot:6189288-Pleurochrysis_carterae.AAC.3